MCVIFSQEQALKNRIILDPGHGGRDFGTMTKSGIKEKDVALNIAREVLRLNKKLNSPLEILLTRYTDTLVSLADRSELARSLDADLLVSLHLNHAENPSARGIEVYIGDRPSKYLSASIWLSYKLQKNFISALGFESRGVKFADFKVLRDATNWYPACLVEIGFLSNPDERNYLTQGKHITFIAKVILTTIINHN
ncbi:N-acetylmuramoyl-L-alanine amidase [Galbibacter marinus]|uniref:N-acetylmuramoyl-L-alanine amidase n=2 Tax=Galbibacter marinus TaxID=555500 RepID=K2Q2H7_9FLAO|nr:N-acetylmuramoyl-L-alanine amidase [Galbibacter marinus]